MKRGDLTVQTAKVLTMATVILFILKVAGFGTFSWWWVFSPIGIPLTLLAAFIIYCFVFKV